ncbi:MAG TPA: DUF2235 domain-containing protein [Burkholderiales bacterium]|nr:DUF2235 domain-containing protein [Burkholderiales bacterium]
MSLYAFDGTWNSAVVDDGEEGEDDTNVVLFFDAYQGRKWYVSGPGTRLGKLGKAVGGFMGAGARERVEEAYTQLCADYAAGDTTIDIVGFSRGAAIALDFANLINDRGIRDSATDAVIANNVSIRFLGLWDVVGSFGIPVGEQLFQKINLGHTLSVPENVEYAFHALAMDDRRQSFRPTRQLQAYEVWFRGVHSDVGGGNGNTGLSCIALRWMLCKAQAAGLPIDAAAIEARSGKMNPDAPLCLPKDLIENAPREFWPGDLIHYSATDRSGHNNAPANYPRETRADELRAVARASLPPRTPRQPPAHPPGDSEHLSRVRVDD